MGRDNTKYLVLQRFRSYGVTYVKGDVITEELIRSPRLRQSEGKITQVVSSFRGPSGDRRGTSVCLHDYLGRVRYRGTRKRGEATQTTVWRLQVRGEYMAFTYEGKPGESEMDWLRFAIGDTVEMNAVLQDGEIQYILDNYKTNTQRLAVAYRQCANHYAARMVKRKLGPQSEDATDRQAYYADMADKYEKALAYAGAPPLPAYSSEAIFDKNMMGNEE